MKTGKGGSGAETMRKILALADPSKTLMVNPAVDGLRDYLETGPEADFQDRVRTMFIAYGWDFYHTRDSRGSDPDFPDCVMARPGRVIVAELKTTSDPTPGQLRWLALFQSVGIPAKLWRPENWEEIEQFARNLNGV